MLRSPVHVIGRVLTITLSDKLRKWWADYKNTGSYSRRSLPFPLFRVFLPPPLPPLFAPATQARSKIAVVHSPAARVPLFCLYHILTSSVNRRTAE